MRFLASGARTSKSNTDVHMLTESPKSLSYVHSEGGRNKNKGKKRKASEGKGSSSSSKGAGKGKGKSQKKGKHGNNLKTTTREGKEICFLFARSGNCEDPCPQGRAHVCQICLQPHRNANCSKKA